ncbi:unnamed protein product [Polarella glacialis]|uniref:Uncharacterized protein n=1 Tax=Polarella glacialis TaxID=89957 RepID=A0A813JMK6_POLGL|nr:unnamed protein product [Polarella glacialis]CAE8679040.1 unnamed protein product [Polarella glacialis]
MCRTLCSCRHPGKRLQKSSRDGGYFAAALLAALAVPTSGAWAKLPSLESDKNSLEGYNFEGLGSRLQVLDQGYNKVKPVCEELQVVVNGGSRTMSENTATRVVCERQDKKDAKANGKEDLNEKEALEAKDALVEARAMKSMAETLRDNDKKRIPGERRR